MTKEKALARADHLSECLRKEPKFQSKEYYNLMHLVKLDRHALAEAFGAQYGWVWDRNSGGVQNLFGRRPHFSQRIRPPHADHSSRYRIGHRVVALVEQPYADGTLLAEMRKWATDQGVIMTTPDWPSWWYPGSTTLCIFTLPDNVPGIASVRSAEARVP